MSSRGWERSATLNAFASDSRINLLSTPRLLVQSGEEARMRYARFLNELGRTDECRAICEETLRRARLGGKIYRRSQSDWIKEAERLA